MTPPRAAALRWMARIPGLVLAWGLLLAGPTAVLAQAAPAASAPDAARGAQAWPMCGTCHGTRGEGLPSVGAPALGGQTSAYIEGQLRAYRADQRGTHVDDVQGNRMRLLAKSIPTDALVADIAALVATLPPAASDHAVAGRATAGRKVYERHCAGCHGPAGQGLSALNAPRIAGLGDGYLLTQLQLFKAGHRGGPGVQAMAPAMAALRDERAMRDVIAWLATQTKRRP
jgi:cytochrome c oxidase subunit II